jgi:hypothetical protein
MRSSWHFAICGRPPRAHFVFAAGGGSSANTGFSSFGQRLVVYLGATFVFRQIALIVAFRQHTRGRGIETLEGVCQVLEDESGRQAWLNPYGRFPSGIAK